MTQQHPITPPPELVREWFSKALKEKPSAAELTRIIAGSAAQWGADQELEACCEWIPKATPWDAEQLRASRRPKPTSLKDQALKEMDKLDAMWDVTSIEDKSLDTIRRALEQLDD